MTTKENAMKRAEQIDGELKTMYQLKNDLSTKTAEIGNLVIARDLHGAAKTIDYDKYEELDQELSWALVELRGIATQMTTLMACEGQNPGYVPKADNEELSMWYHDDFHKTQEMQQLRRDQLNK